MSGSTCVNVVSRLVYPDPRANALQTIHMAAAFARATSCACLHVHDLVVPEQTLFGQYALDPGPLRIRPYGVEGWPSLVRDNARNRFITYNSLVALNTLGRSFSRGRHVLFVRSRLETLYWGLLKPYLPWMRTWIAVCEMHDLDLPMLDQTTYDPHSTRTKRTVQALRRFDVVIALTSKLAEDIRSFSQGQIQPAVMPLCTALPRAEAPARYEKEGRPYIVGYLGTIDPSHGLEDVFQCAQRLPAHVRVRLIGWVPDAQRAWFEHWMQAVPHDHPVEWKPQVHYAEVAAEIDECDILLAPAGTTLHSQNYRSPLKLFDYMARGKPIVAAHVPAHLELLKDGENALTYRPGDPDALAERILSLVDQPEKAEAIAQAAWRLSAQYTYDARAQKILTLIDAVS